MAKIGQSIFVGLLILSIYLNIGTDYSQSGIGNVAGCNFFILVGLFMNWMFGSILTFQLERDVFLREQANKMYSPVPYFMAKNAVETPAVLLGPMLTLLALWHQWVKQFVAALFDLR